jgi:hypothetical protein
MVGGPPGMGHGGAGGLLTPPLRRLASRLCRLPRGRRDDGGSPAGADPHPRARAPGGPAGLAGPGGGRGAPVRGVVRLARRVARERRRPSDPRYRRPDRRALARHPHPRRRRQPGGPSLHAARGGRRRGSVRRAARFPATAPAGARGARRALDRPRRARGRAAGGQRRTAWCAGPAWSRSRPAWPRARGSGPPSRAGSNSASGSSALLLEFRRIVK